MSSKQAASRLATTHIRATAFKILHLSYMELLCEGARPEVRLHRLLGHVSVYENASRWWLESKMTGLYFVRRYNQDNEGTPSEDCERQNAMVTKAAMQVPHIRSLQEFQAATKSRIQRQVVPLTIEEMTEHSHGGSSDDHDRVGIWSHDGKTTG
jgi:hypothetical protein